MTKFVIGIVNVIIVAASGCELTPDAQESEVDQALSADFVDGSGTVTVRIKQCPATSPGEHLTTNCSVDSDFVLIGGGAEILGEGSPGALLTASYPDSGLSTWTASSKDQVDTFSHQLSAYAVGLKLAGVSPSTLRSSMLFVSSQSNPAQHPSTTAELPPGFILIGGGARANWSTEGQLLTSSFPDSFQWVAASKDHLRAETGTVNAYAIGITSGTIPGFGSSLDVTVNRTLTFVSTGYATVSASTPTGWVLSSIGGDAQYSGVGRMLTDLIPFVDAPTNSQAGALVRSKDHHQQDSGNTFAYLLSIRRH